eukprot:scaffold307673_cov13-Tisochrysis_lutea.AAC.1
MAGRPPRGMDDDDEMAGNMNSASTARLPHAVLCPLCSLLPCEECMGGKQQQQHAICILHVKGCP